MTLKEAMNRIHDSGLVMEINEELRGKIQKCLLDMYHDIICVCEAYEITPYLVGGSALGAIRHHGFIPWDDDIDIGMTRTDYLRFQNVFEKELSDKYILNAPNYVNNAVTRFPKIMKRDTKYIEIGLTNDTALQCLAIDIFIIENVPENRLHRFVKGLYCNTIEFIAGRVVSFQNRSKTSTELLKATGLKSYLINRLIGIVFSYRKYARWNDMVDRAVQYNRDSSLCSLPTGRKHYFGEMHEKKKLLPALYVQFENLQAPVFQGYDCYLKQLYGDYMIIPPESKREKHFVEKVEL